MHGSSYVHPYTVVYVCGVGGDQEQDASSGPMYFFSINSIAIPHTYLRHCATNKTERPHDKFEVRPRPKIARPKAF